MTKLKQLAIAAFALAPSAGGLAAHAATDANLGHP